MSNILLLTATITPPGGVPALVRTDPKLRLEDYKKALQFYLSQLEKGVDGIVFTENSSSDLTELKQLVESEGLQDKVEFLSFAGLDHPPSYGRGYGEFKLVDYAMAHSKLIASCDDPIVWKCTGRYIVQNLSQLIKSRPNCDLYCHMRNYAYKLCELFMMSWNRTGYEKIIRGVYLGLRNDIVPGVHTIEETSFRTIVDASLNKAKVVRRFRHVPLIVGIRGWNNSNYSDREFDPKILLRRAANLLAPWLWI